MSKLEELLYSAWEFRSLRMAADIMQCSMRAISEGVEDIGCAIKGRELAREWSSTMCRFAAGNYDSTRNVNPFYCPSESFASMEVERTGNTRNDIIVAAIAYAEVAGNIQLQARPVPTFDECVACMTEMRCIASRPGRTVCGDLMSRCFRVVVYQSTNTVSYVYNTPSTRLEALSLNLESDAGRKLAERYAKMCMADRENFDRALRVARQENAKYREMLAGGFAIDASMRTIRNITFATNIFVALLGQLMYRFMYTSQLSELYETLRPSDVNGVLVFQPAVRRAVSHLLHTFSYSESTPIVIRRFAASHSMPIGAYEASRRLNGSAEVMDTDIASLFEEVVDKDVLSCVRTKLESDTILIKQKKATLENTDEVWHIMSVNSHFVSALGVALDEGHLVFEAGIYDAEPRIISEAIVHGRVRTPIIVFLCDSWRVHVVDAEVSAFFVTCSSFVQALSVWAAVMLNATHNGLTDNGLNIKAGLEDFIRLGMRTESVEQPDDALVGAVFSDINATVKACERILHASTNPANGQSVSDEGEDNVVETARPDDARDEQINTHGRRRPREGDYEQQDPRRRQTVHTTGTRESQPTGYGRRTRPIGNDIGYTELAVDD